MTCITYNCDSKHAGPILVHLSLAKMDSFSCRWMSRSPRGWVSPFSSVQVAPVRSESLTEAATLSTSSGDSFWFPVCSTGAKRRPLSEIKIHLVWLMKTRRVERHELVFTG